MLTIPVGYLQTNCYIYTDKAGNTAVIDPGDNPDLIIKTLEGKGITPAIILLTHGHFDHTMAVSSLVERYNIPVCIHEDEVKLLADPNLNGSRRKSICLTADRLLQDGEVICGLKVIHTPGHTAGGCCYYNEDGSQLFSGDTLFNLSVGRTDFATGSQENLISSIKNKLFTLPPDTVVYPGHGKDTTIGRELSLNPYVR